MTTKWEKIAHVAGVLALILVGVNIYFTHFIGASLLIHSFPSEYEIRSYDINKDISFSFDLHNDGGKTAFIKYSFIYQITGSGKEILYSRAKSSPDDNFYIDPGETQQINITLPAPHAQITNEFKIEFVYEPGFKRVESDILTATWINL